MQALPPCPPALQGEYRAHEEGEDVREQPHVLAQHPPHPVRKGQRPLPVGHVRQHSLHQVHCRHLRALRVAGGGTPLVPCTRRRRAVRSCNSRSVPARTRAPAPRTPGTGRNPAPRTGAGRAPPRSPPSAAWPGSPSPPRPAPSPPDACAGTPTRASPPAPPQPHLARAHAPEGLPRASVEPLAARRVEARPGQRIRRGEPGTKRVPNPANAPERY
jgi:hypothetical protein